MATSPVPSKFDGLGIAEPLTNLELCLKLKLLPAIKFSVTMFDVDVRPAMASRDDARTNARAPEMETCFPATAETDTTKTRAKNADAAEVADQARLPRWTSSQQSRLLWQKGNFLKLHAGTI